MLQEWGVFEPGLWSVVGDGDRDGKAGWVEVMWVSQGAECLKSLTLGSRDHW